MARAALGGLGKPGRKTIYRTISATREGWCRTFCTHSRHNLRHRDPSRLDVKHVTPNMVGVAAAWRGARARHAAELDDVEGAEANAAQALMPPR